MEASGSFDAGHSIPDYEPCARGHGHHWDVRVQVSGDLDPRTGWTRGSAPLAGSLRVITEELNGTQLPEMLPGVITSPLGLASYFLDRLALQFPAITRVRVDCSDGTAGVVKRTPRQL